MAQPETRTQPTLIPRSVRSSPLFWAALVSMAVHSILVAMPLARHGNATRMEDEPGTLIEATLVPASESATGVDALVVPAPLEPGADYALPPSPAPAAAIANAARPQAQATGGTQGGVLVEAQPMQDVGRLSGELQTRQMSDFPMELDSPVGLRQTIVARYPPAAMAAGREGSVIAWVVVDARGSVEEIQIADGAEEFANAVVAAVREGRFIPAQINAAPVRFPIALEFRFSAAKPTASPDARLVRPAEVQPK